ncbi:MAG: hypothetical protein GXP26_12040 [Planctomycetes bacterium]|nr:hypothetical protein [Planctomycetota bacterium]
MKVTTTVGLLATILVLVGSLVGRVEAALLLNPSFESPDVLSTGYTDVDPTNWVVTETVSFQVSLFDRADFPGVDGDQFVAFNAGATPTGSSINQAFGTIAGASYEVSFWTAANVPAISSVNAMIFDGVGIGMIPLASQNNNLGGPFSFVQTTFSFTASSGTTTLAFVDDSTETVSSDLFLDHVEITLISVPEPSPIILIGLGSLCLAFTHNRMWGSQKRCPQSSKYLVV